MASGHYKEHMTGYVGSQDYLRSPRPGVPRHLYQLILTQFFFIHLIGKCDLTWDTLPLLRHLQNNDFFAGEKSFATIVNGLSVNMMFSELAKFWILAKKKDGHALSIINFVQMLYA